MDIEHYHKLEHLFYAANIQQIYPGINMHINSESTVIMWPVHPQHFHGGDALHGSVYFKMMDDAAYFAAAAQHVSTFLVTASFNIKLLHPVTSGILTATGKVTHVGSGRYQAESYLTDINGNKMATGAGIFVPTKTPWNSLSGYCL